MEEKRIKKVAAIKYDMGSTAPTVVAKGQGEVADRILSKATEADIPVYEDKELVDTLLKLDLGDQIPPELYEVVAEILVFVDDMDKLYKRINVK